MPIQQILLGAGGSLALADPGQVQFDAHGQVYTWTVPDGVYSVSVVCMKTIPLLE